MSAFKSDHQIIRDYVTAIDHLQYTNLPDGVVCVNMTHSNLPMTHPDIRLDLHMTIADVKAKFRTHIGTPVDHQKLVLKDGNRVLYELSDDSKMLGYYSVVSGNTIHIIDTDPFSLSRNGGLTDTSLVEKFKLSDEAYSQRKGTMREYIQEQRKLNPNFKLRPQNMNASKSEEPAEIPDATTVAGIEVGMRCEVTPGARRGIVRFVGEISSSSSGYWVGVQFDEPVGKSDGTIKGEKIFECLPGFGGFVRGKNVKVGDYPERSILDELDDDNMDGCECDGQCNSQEDEKEIDEDEI